MTEINFLRQCDSCHIVRFSGCYHSGNEFWIAMEFCSRGSVGDIVRKVGALSEAEVAVVMKGSLLGLEYLHSHSIIHRDIKVCES